MNEAKRKTLEELSELFEIDLEELGDDFVLDEEVWDSLAIVTAVAAVHKYYKRLLEGNRVEKFKTLGELFAAAEGAD